MRAKSSKLSDISLLLSHTALLNAPKSEIPAEPGGAHKVRRPSIDMRIAAFKNSGNYEEGQNNRYSHCPPRLLLRFLFTDRTGTVTVCTKILPTRDTL